MRKAIQYSTQSIVYTAWDSIHVYYFQQVSTNMKPALEAFKAARLFSPFHLNEINPSVASLDTLTAFLFWDLRYLLLSKSFLFIKQQLRMLIVLMTRS